MELALEHVDHGAQLHVALGRQGDLLLLELDLRGEVLEVVPCTDLPTSLVDGVDQLLVVEVTDHVERELLGHAPEDTGHDAAASRPGDRSDLCCRRSQVVRELLHRGMAGVLVRHAQDRRRVHRRGDRRSVVEVQYLSAMLGDAEVPAEQRLRGRRAEETMSSGRTASISASSQGRQAAISSPLGVAWIRRLPRGVHLKCFTALVM